MFSLSLSHTEGEELKRLIATGKKNLLWRSVLHLDGNSLLLKVLLRYKLSAKSNRYAFKMPSEMDVESSLGSQNR